MSNVTDLTFEQAIIAAYAHYVRGIKQSDIAIIMHGVNHGRVNEAVKAIEAALLTAGYVKQGSGGPND